MKSAFDEDLPLHWILSGHVSTISIIRMLSFLAQDNVSDRKWLKQHSFEVKCLGRILQFLGIAVPDKKANIGWERTDLFMDLLTTVPDPKLDWSGKRTKNDALLADMLYGIVINAAKQYPHFRRWRRHQTKLDKLRVRVVKVASPVLYHLNLIYEAGDGRLKPTPIMKELFVKAVQARS